MPIITLYTSDCIYNSIKKLSKETHKPMTTIINNLLYEYINSKLPLNKDTNKNTNSSLMANNNRVLTDKDLESIKNIVAEDNDSLMSNIIDAIDKSLNKDQY